MFTALMFVVLIVSYALMVGLVRFVEHIVARGAASTTDSGAAAGEADAAAPSTER